MMQNKNKAFALAIVFSPMAHLSALAETTIPKTREITTHGDAVVRVIPDMFSFTIGIQTQEKQLFSAYDLNEKRATNVLAVAQKYKLRAEDVQTSHMSVLPRRIDRSHSLSSITEPYRVDRSVTFVVRDKKQLAPLMRDVLDEGATSIVSLTYDTSELRKHKDAARVLALKAAREKAQLLAESIGAKVGKPMEIEETQFSYFPLQSNNRVLNQNAMDPTGDAEMDSEQSSAAIAAGRISVRASIKAKFELE